MASTFTDIGTELMTTGENAGNWGTKTNTNLQILEEAVAGYATQALTSGGTVTLTYTDGSVGDVARHAVIALTGALSGNAVVEVPSNEKIWIIDNQSTNAYTVTVRVNGQSGVTWGTSDKGTKILYANGTDVVDTNIGGGVGGHDLNGEELILDADADTSITADTDDQIDIKIAGADDFQFTANTFTAQSGSTIAAQALTATTVTASGIIKTDSTTAATSTTDGSLQTDGGLSVAADAIIGDDLKLLSDSAVLSFGADSDTTVTHTDGTGLTLNSTNKLCFNDASQFVQGSSATVLSIGATDEIDLTATAIDINGTCDISGTFSLAGTNITTTAAEINLIDGAASTGTTAVADADGILTNDGGTMRLTTAATFKTYFQQGVTISDLAADDISVGDAAVTIGNGSTSADVTLDSGDDVVIDAAGGNVEFKDAGTLQLSLDMDGTAGVQIIKLGVDSDDLVFQQYDGNEVMRINDNRKLCFFDDGGEHISSDGTDFTFASGNDINLTATTDINVPSGVGMTFGNDGEKIEGDGTDLTIAGNNINLTAVADVVIPANVGITFGSGEKIEGDSTDLTITSGAKINLTATSDIHIPNDVGIVFGGASEKIEGDGTDLVISANNLTVDAAADIILDAGGNDWSFKSGGTEVLKITNSSSDVIIKPIVDAKDIIFQQRDGTEVARIEDNGTFNIVTDKLAINGTAVTSTAAELNKVDGVGTLAQAGKQTIWVPAQAMTPTTSNGCATLATVETTSGRPDMNVLDFDKDSDEFAQFAVAFPKSWNSGVVTYQFFWSGLAATTTVTLTLAGVSFADNDSIDTAYGTAVAVEDTAQGAVEECLVSAESGNVTIAGSPGDNELTYFRIGRDVSEDNMAGDCRLHGVKLFFTTDLANDA